MSATTSPKVPPPTPTRLHKWSVLWRTRALPPLLALVVALSVWQIAIWAFDIPRVLLPSPIDVAVAAARDRMRLALATLRTAAAAISGFGFSLLVGTLISLVFSQSRALRASLFPYAIFLQTVPIIAIAPLIVIWIGEGAAAVVTVSFLISLFPIITNGTTGMLSASVQQHELFRLNQATRWQILRKLQLPSSLPYLVTGARISSGLAVLGAIVGEYFAGAGSQSPGLGYLIFAAKDQFALDTLFAAVFLCTSLGIVIFSLVGYVGQRWLLYWQDVNDHLS